MIFITNSQKVEIRDLLVKSVRDEYIKKYNEYTD